MSEDNLQKAGGWYVDAVANNTWFHVMQGDGVLLSTEDGEFARWLADSLNQRAAIDFLRAGEDDTVEMVCDNPDFSGPNNLLWVTGMWTGFDCRRFAGESIAKALEAAVAAKKQWQQGATDSTSNSQQPTPNVQVNGDDKGGEA